MSKDIEKLQDLAKSMIGRYQKEIENIDDRIDSLHKWIVAACLSINGIAITQVFGNEAIDSRSQFYSTVWFVLGIIACISYVMLVNSLLSKTAGRLRSIVHQSEKFPRDENDIPDFVGKANPLTLLYKMSIAVDYFQLAALICFVVGVGIAGFGIK